MNRRWLVWIGAAFAAWYLIAQPTEAAHAVTNAASGLATAAGSLATFVNTLGDE
jgi:hypothetical protein